MFVNGQRVDKPGTAVPNDAKIEIRGNTLKYVSRGGLKLEKAMAEFPIELDGCICGEMCIRDRFMGSESGIAVRTQWQSGSAIGDGAPRN